MLPVMLDLSFGAVLLVGSGRAALRRLKLLEEAGASDIRVYLPHSAADDGSLAGLKALAGPRLRPGLPDAAEIGAARALFVADSAHAAELAAAARRLGVLVNVEDVKSLCDFYTPSVVRRGRLAIAVSTEGASPGLARRLREHIESLFGPEWAGGLEELAALRLDWQAAGLDMAAITARTNQWIEGKGWL